MSTVSVGLSLTTNVTPTIRLSIDDGDYNGPKVTWSSLTPDEARAIGLQLKVMADQVDKMKEADALTHGITP